jgi:hypothetical protein
LGENIECSILQHNLAVVYETMGDTAKAVECQEKATDLIESFAGLNNQRTVLYRNLINDFLERENLC